MTTHKSFIPVLLTCLVMSAPAMGAATQAAEPAMTQAQAVLKVQQETGGRVLSAESHRVDRKLKYFIKVLKPDGHVQKLVVSPEASKNSATGQSTKNPPAKRAGSKEKH
jgi:uncharacterized membrane protein YkoI